eukprot:12709401-Alexandrium_andersonii.AAC.1
MQGTSRKCQIVRSAPKLGLRPEGPFTAKPISAPHLRSTMCRARNMIGAASAAHPVDQGCRRSTPGCEEQAG